MKYQYRLAWQCKKSGVEEQGYWTELSEKELAALHADKRQKQRTYPDVDYWIESREVKEDTKLC